MELLVAEVVGGVAAPDLDVGSAAAVEPLSAKVEEPAARVEWVETHVLDLVVPLMAFGAKVLPGGDACKAEADVEDEEEQGVREAAGGVHAEEEAPAGGVEPCVGNLVVAHGEQVYAGSDSKGKEVEEVPVVALADAIAEPGTVVVHVCDADAALGAMRRPHGAPDVARIAVLHVDGVALRRRYNGPFVFWTGHLDPAVILLWEAVLLEAVGNVDILREGARVEQSRLEQAGKHLQGAVGEEHDHGGRHLVPEPGGLKHEAENHG